MRSARLTKNPSHINITVIMKSISPIVLIAALAITSVSTAETTLFTDSFDRVNNADVNLNSAANQSGTLAPLNWTSHIINGGANSEISSNTLFNATDGTANSLSRAVLDYDISDSSAAIVADGGFEVSFTQTTGIDYASTIHGSYSSRIYLSQKSIAKSTIGTGNLWQGLGVEIRGNGQVTVYSQSATIGPTTHSSVWNTQGANDIRLVVATDGFNITSDNSVSIYVNDSIVFSDLSFNWKSDDDVYLGLEAGGYSASFDNVALSTVPEPSSSAVLFGVIALAVGVTRRGRS